jgi:hypothetical protein
MPRFTDASLISALESDSFSYATLISLGTQSSLIRITDNDKDVTLNADTYTSTTTLLDYGEAQETMVSYMLSNDYIGLPVDIKRCALSDSNVVIGSFTYFKGQVSGFEIVDTNDKSEVLVNCKSHWADFEKLNGRRTNHNSQQLHFSGDLGFEFAAKTIKDIRWGKA